MGHSNTMHLSLVKPEHADPDTVDSWDTVVNGNMDIIDSAVGDRTYTEHNYIADGQPLASSLNALDVATKDVSDMAPTSDQKAALVGEGTPSSLNKYVCKDYARPLRKLILTPEYAGAVLYAPGGSHTGAMTASMEEPTRRYNYYKWLSSEVTLQSYYISVQWRVPESLLAWQAKALRIDMCTELADAAECKIDVTVSKDGVPATTVIKSGLFSTAPATWYSDRGNDALIEFSNTELGTILSIGAGDFINIDIRLYSRNSRYAKVGNMTFYLQC